MKSKLKTKLQLSLSFLFVVILIFGILGLFYIGKLSHETNNIIKNNYETLRYTNNMLKLLEELPSNAAATTEFKKNLILQEHNISEDGEAPLTRALRADFNKLITLKTKDSVLFSSIRKVIFKINDLNENSIYRKNGIAIATASNATIWLSIIFSIFSLIAFSLVYNIPDIIAKPINVLSEGISEISRKNYSKRIFLNRNDEFGELALAFNSMAEKLDEYEHSNLARIKFEKSRIETIISQMKDGIVGIDEYRNVLFVNSVAETLLSIKESEVVGKKVDNLAMNNDLLRTLLLKEPAKELKIYAEGKLSYFNKEQIDVKHNDRIIGQVIVLKNITPYHEQSEAKTNFIATISHELKTPISSIKMSASLLRDKRISAILDKEQIELISGIQEDADRLLKITKELLDVSQVETGNIQLKMVPVNVSEIVDPAVNTVLFQAQQKQIALVTMIDKDLPPVYADMEKSSWVLVNFLTNAIKFSSSSTEIRVLVHSKNNKVYFTVQDQGVGIDKRYQEKIFEKYFKIPGSFDKTGTGLGLSISKEFIEAQAGEIGVTSTLGEGSTFYFSLNIY